MSVVGFDIGNQKCAIAVAKPGGIDVLLNDESKRETPAVVSFGEKQRFLGSAGAAFATKFPKSTISQIKRLIGREYREQSVQEDLKLLPFEISEGQNGGVSIHLEFLGKKRTFMTVEILGMLFAHLKQMTEKNLESPVVDCVIGIPSYFTDMQRREYLNAAFIAGLRPLQLVHDCTAVALGYGKYKTDFSNIRLTNVVFVDIGQCDTQVTVAAFIKGKMTILAHSFDPNLGGRDFDEALFSHFATQFRKEYDIDVYSNVRASVRLRAACEKLKKVLSANEEAPLVIECLVDDKDLVGFITREEFVKLSAELLERFTDACCKARKDSGLCLDGIHRIELVGCGSRIPAIMRKVASVFGKEPMRTLNGSECVARGCALYCAMLSPDFHVQDFEIRDIFPYSLGLVFYADENRRCPEVTLFLKGSLFPSTKTCRVVYDGNITFFCDVFCTNEMDSAISLVVGRFMIRPTPDQISGEKNVKATCTVNVQLNVNGIFEIKSASFVQDVESRRSNTREMKQKLSVSENHHFQTTKDEIQHRLFNRVFHDGGLGTSNTTEMEQKLSVSENHHLQTTKDEIQHRLFNRVFHESNTTEMKQKLSVSENHHLQTTKDEIQHTNSRLLNRFFHDGGLGTSNTTEMEQKLSVSENHHLQTTKDEIQHTNSRLLNRVFHDVELRTSNTREMEQKLLVSENYHILTTKDEIQEAPKRAQLFKEQDIKVEKTEEKRNALESFIYKTQKLLSSYRSVATVSELENISKSLQDTEEWLYGEGDDESEQVYIRKLEDFEKLLYPIEVRYKDENDRKEAVITLQNCIRENCLAAESLPPSQKQQVNNQCIQAELWLNLLSEGWLNLLSQMQDSSTKTDTCVYCTDAIIGITQALKRRCEGIFTSKPSLLKYEEPVDSDLNQNPIHEKQVDN